MGIWAETEVEVGMVEVCIEMKTAVEVEDGGGREDRGRNNSGGDM